VSGEDINIYRYIKVAAAVVYVCHSNVLLQLDNLDGEIVSVPVYSHLLLTVSPVYIVTVLCLDALVKELLSY